MFNNLQALRAYAALSVILVHLLPLYGFSAPFGHYGVDLFFVLSGFLMARISATDTSRFLTRRLIRIVPAYWVCTIGVFLLACFQPALLHSTKPDWINLVKSLLFIPYRKESGLLQPVLNPGWTLNYEMFFYVVFAIVLWLKLPRPSIWAAVLVSLLPALALGRPPGSDCRQFYSAPIVMDFVLGITVYHLCSRWAARPAERRWTLAALLAGVLTLPFVEIGHGLYQRVFWLGVPAAIIVLLAVRLEQAGWGVKNPVLLLVGDASYLLYLTQIYVLQLGEKMIGLNRFNRPVKILLGLGLVLGAVALACTLHRYCEVPVLQTLKRRLLPPKAAKAAAHFPAISPATSSQTTL